MPHWIIPPISHINRVFVHNLSRKIKITPGERKPIGVATIFFPFAIMQCSKHILEIKIYFRTWVKIVNPKVWFCYYETIGPLFVFLNIVLIYKLD